MSDILNALSLNRNIDGRYFIKRRGSAERGMTMIVDIILPSIMANTQFVLILMNLFFKY